MKQIRLTLLLALLIVKSATAQTLQLPFTSDNYWHPGAEIFNTAMIAYGMSPTDVIYASAWNGGGGVYVSDANASGTVAVTPAGQYMPDVIIGNTFTAPGSQYILAVAHAVTGGVQIEFYNITTPGTIVTWVTSTLIPTIADPNIVHIDVIADPTLSSFTGFPFCNRFVVTWDDVAGNVWAAYGDLNTMTTLTTPVFIGMGTEPDVSAIQRSSGGPIDDIALITWVDPGTNILWYREYDFTTMTYLGGPIMLDNGTWSTGTILHPRIDAYDDYIINANPLISQYKVVAQVMNTGTGKWEVRNYDNLLYAASTYWTSSNVVDLSASPWFMPPNYDHYSPVVAISGGSRNQKSGMYNYVVSHFANFSSGQDALFTEPIDNTIPNALSNMPNWNTYYWTNSNGGSFMDAVSAITWSWSGALSICSPENLTPNMVMSPTLYAWSERGAGWNTNFKLVGGNYAFRQNQSAVKTLSDHGWEVYPNPATSTLTISNTIKGNNAGDYSIIDMTGRKVLNGTLASTSVTIDISKLTPGNYVIRMMKEGAPNGEMKFVKQ